MNTRILALSLAGVFGGGCGGPTEATELSPLAQLVQALGLSGLIAPNGVGDPTIDPNGVGHTTTLPDAAWGRGPAPDGVGPAPGDDPEAAPGRAGCDEACDKIEACGIEVERCGRTCRDLLDAAGAAGQGLIDCVVNTSCDQVLGCVPSEVIEEFDDDAPRAPDRIEF